jgi:hypothetical protein
MGSVTPIPLRGIDFGLKALNKIARMGLAARWISSVWLPAEQRWLARTYYRRLYRAMLPLDLALDKIKADRDLICARLREGERTVYHEPPIVVFLRRRGSTLVIDDFMTAGLEPTLGSIDRIARRFGR